MNTEAIVIEGDSSSLATIHSTLEKHAHWLLRMALASVFIFHGAGKLFVLQKSAEMLGLSAEVTLLVGLAEVLAAFALLIGPFTSSTITRLGALAIIPIMIGAIAMVHWGRWSFTPAEGFPMGGMEFQVVLTLIASYLLIKGND